MYWNLKINIFFSKTMIISKATWMMDIPQRYSFEDAEKMANRIKNAHGQVFRVLEVEE